MAINDFDNIAFYLSSIFINVECLVEEEMIRCVFPFLYNGFLYNGCILDPDDEKSYWCATKVDSNGFFCDHEWGHCNENCPRVDISMIKSDLL